jgi:hypothetical protein
MSDKIEQAAEEYASYNCYEWTFYKPLLRNAFKAVVMSTQSTITTLQSENERLRGALEKIAEGCSPKEPIDDLTYSEIKELATEALTPKE